jgi:hypothetical protein
MNFTLTYDGNLKANGDIKLKQEIRRIFHCQLQELWKGSSIDPSDPKSKNLKTTIGKFTFLPLVSAGRNEVAELQIIMLRPGQPPGYIIGEGGDIDNRLKTLFDSLRMPKDNNEIPLDDKPADSEDPFFCLLEDDILIINLSVATDRLLEPCKSDSYVKLIIRIQIKSIQRIGASMMTYFIRH